MSTTATATVAGGKFICENCEDLSAEWICTQCNMKMCGDCDHAFHKPQKMHGHHRTEMARMRTMQKKSDDELMELCRTEGTVRDYSDVCSSSGDAGGGDGSSSSSSSSSTSTPTSDGHGRDIFKYTRTYDEGYTYLYVNKSKGLILNEHLECDLRNLTFHNNKDAQAAVVPSVVASSSSSRGSSSSSSSSSDDAENAENAGRRSTAIIDIIVPPGQVYFLHLRRECVTQPCRLSMQVRYSLQEKRMAPEAQQKLRRAVCRPVTPISSSSSSTTTDLSHDLATLRTLTIKDGGRESYGDVNERAAPIWKNSYKFDRGYSYYYKNGTDDVTMVERLEFDFDNLEIIEPKGYTAKEVVQDKNDDDGEGQGDAGKSSSSSPPVVLKVSLKPGDECLVVVRERESNRGFSMDVKSSIEISMMEKK